MQGMNQSEKKHETQAEFRVKKSENFVLAWTCTVAVLNAILMAALSSHPFTDPTWQLSAGAAAMALHGWGGWEVARGLNSWARASHDLAEIAVWDLRKQVLRPGHRKKG